MIGLTNANSLHIPLANKSIHAIVTSPPYPNGIREYENAKERLGIKALEAWQNGRKAEMNTAGLPMFEAVRSD